MKRDRFRVLYISQSAEPGWADLSVYRGLDEGEDDIAWFASRLVELGVLEAVDLCGIEVCRGGRLPRIDDFDAAVIGGSYHMVSDRRPWQLELLSWLDRSRPTGRYLLGICGGHQLMAHHFGAMVKPVPDEVWAETTTVQLTDAGRHRWLFRNLGASTEYHFANYQHVTTVPPGTVATAIRGRSPAIALDYGGNWVSVQFHPEMSAEAMSASWRPTAPQRARCYRPTPLAPYLLLNFLRQAGLKGNTLYGD